MGCLSFISTLSNPPLLFNLNPNPNPNPNPKPNRMYVVRFKVESSSSRNSFQKFLHFALDEFTNKTHLTPSPLQDKYGSTIAMDGKTELQMLSFQAPKIRLLRSLSIESETMQVLDLAVLPKAEFDLPIFCANFFATNNLNIIVLDLNPLYNVIDRVDYKDKYYKNLMPLAMEYTKLLPWGGKLTSESLRFFSPIVIWTKFSSTKDNYDILYSAFVEYYKAWLVMMDGVEVESNISLIHMNSEAQHKYLTWRAEKDPGHRVLKKLIGDSHAKDLVKNFLFNGIDELGTMTFLDYFPEYKCEDGKINVKRSVIGKSFEHRPWNSRGEFVANGLI